MSQHKSWPFCFSVTMQKQKWWCWGWSLDEWQSTALSLAAQHNQGHHLGSLVFFVVFSAPAATFLFMSWPTGVIRNSKFSMQFSVFSVYMLGFYNGLWPEKVQHLPHVDTGPFPVLGISVLCWSNSDSSFKMFNAAIS